VELLYVCKLIQVFYPCWFYHQKNYKETQFCIQQIKNQQYKHVSAEFLSLYFLKDKNTCQPVARSAISKSDTRYSDEKSEFRPVCRQAGMTISFFAPLLVFDQLN
jgi:hypothetical protein